MNEQEIILGFVVLVIGFLVGKFFPYISSGKKAVVELGAELQGFLDGTPFGFLDVDELAESFVRAALNHGGLGTHQEKVDFAVAKISELLSKTEKSLGVDLEFLKPYVRPAVNAAFSRLAEEFAKAETLPAEIKHFVKV